MVMQRIAFLAMLVAVWLICFPHTLLHIEENSYWIDAPDMTSIIYQWPAEWSAIFSCYLGQFFQYRFWGALILGILPLLTLLAADVILWRLFRQRALLWLSFIPATWTALCQTGDSTLEPSIRIAVLMWMVAIIVLIVTFRSSLYSIKKPFRWMYRANALLPYLGIMTVAGILITDTSRRSTEFTNHIEHLTAEHQWDRVYELTYPKRYDLDDNLMSYSLLALSEKGLLPQQLFSYPVRGLENVFTSAENFRFNSFFCHELGLPNEAIRYAFEEGQYMPAGASFGTLRRMVDWILEKGDDPELANYYLNLLSHSSCHKQFIAARRIYMVQNQPKPIKHKPEYVGSPSFLHEAAVVFDRDPYNERARDYLLCGMLLTGNIDAFFTLFENIYVQTEDQPIPTHYMEALVELAASHPQIATSYTLPANMQQRYNNFCTLLQQPRGNKRALEQFKDTYWAYQLRQSGNHAQQAEAALITAPVIGAEFGY